MKQIEKKLLKGNWVDVCGGKITLEELKNEISMYMFRYEPKEMVVTIQRKQDGYRGMIYIHKDQWKIRQ